MTVIKIVLGGSLNIIDLSYFRALHRSQRGPRLLLITNRASPLLSELDCQWGVTPIMTEAHLAEQRAAADLVLIDPRVKWTDPWAITPELSQSTPVVWLAAPYRRKQKSWIRSAYSCGVSDIIYSPFAKDDLEEAISVLLRLNPSIRLRR